ncbi:Guanosine-5'-triphosphate,3'-diphosphate pyrophosphatase [Streptomyces sp. enrichment culture]
MRLSVVDVGSNTVRLMIADVDEGAPLPVHTTKWKLRLSQQVDADGRLPEKSVNQLVEAVAAADKTARRWGADAPLAFATAVVRNAPNRLEVLQTIRSGTGVQICTLPGEVEAELTFLGARRWMGWQAGPLALFDIGGGSLEVAFGRGRLPDFAVSLPLGANRLTREFFGGEDPPSARSVKALRRKVRHQLRDVAERLRWEDPHCAVATSRTFHQLARLSGAAPGRQGPFVSRHLTRADLRLCIDKLAVLPAAERAELPGISAPRAGQSLAGAIVGHTVMKLTGIKTARVCPWALREGVLLRYLEDGAAWWTAVAERSDGSVTTGGVPLQIEEPTDWRAGAQTDNHLASSSWSSLDSDQVAGKQAQEWQTRDPSSTPTSGASEPERPVSGPPYRTVAEDVREGALSPTAERAALLREAEPEQLREALDRRPVIDVARGVLMAAWSCTPEEARQILVWVSQHSNTKLYDVAEAVVATAGQEPLPAHLQGHLTAALAHRRTGRFG